MHDLTADQKEILAELWDELDWDWWGPQIDDFHSTHMDMVRVTESLMTAGLISQNADSKDVFRLRFLVDGFYYLDNKRQAEASKDTAVLIETMKRLYPIRKNNRIVFPDFASDCHLTPEAAGRALVLLLHFGVGVSNNLTAGPDSTESFIVLSSQIAKATTFEDAFEAKKKEHLAGIKFRGRMVKGDFVWAQPAVFSTAPEKTVAPNSIADVLKSRKEDKPKVLGSLKSFCERCNGETNHNVYGELAETKHTDDEDADVAFVCWDWKIIRCLGCNETRFRERYYTSEDLRPAGAEPEGTITIYPVPQKRKPREFASAPEAIRSLYSQTFLALNGSMLHLCAGGLRATLEAVCSDKGIEDGGILDDVSFVPKFNKLGQPLRKDNLEGKIWGLAEKGLVTVNDAALLHKHRFLGNDALHDALAPSEESLGHALDVIEHVLEKIYELPGKAAKIKRVVP